MACWKFCSVRPPLFRTRITDLFGIRHPILCGGFIWLADAAYVAAVVNAGGMGFITALSFPDSAEDFRREIRKCRALTKGVGALKDAGCVVIHKVPAVRYALSAEKMGVDAITVVGGEAGGHPGIFMIGSMVQAALAADAIKLPLAVGGGMGTGRHLVTALALGADAMLLGSRMLCASEIWAHSRYKERIVAASELDNRVVMKIFRHIHRVLDNDTARAVDDLETRGTTDFESYRELVNGRVTRRAYKTGDWSQGMLDLGPAGAFARGQYRRSGTGPRPAPNTCTRLYGFMRACSTWDQFYRMMNRAFPKKGQTIELALGD
jgi:nitronate monooxygenase